MSVATTKQKEMIKNGDLKMIGVLLAKPEQYFMEELQGLANELYPFKRFNNSTFFRFLLAEYGEDMKQNILNELALKERLKNESDF